jgi:hypothetical protein
MRGNSSRNMQASGVSTLAAESALPVKPTVGRPKRMPQLNQAEQPVGVVPARRSLRSPATGAAQQPSFTVDRSQDALQLAQRGISRRTFLLRLARLTVVGVGGSSLVLLACSKPPTAPSTMVALFVRTHVTYSGWWMHGKGETVPSEEALPSCALATLTLQAAHLSYSPPGETQSFARS